MKPITASEGVYNKSLEKYLTRSYIPGGLLDDIPSAKIDFGNSSVEILVNSIGLGKIQYALNLNNEQKSTVEVAETILANEDFNAIFETKENLAKVGIVTVAIIGGVVALAEGNSAPLEGAIEELNTIFPTFFPVY